MSMARMCVECLHHTLEKKDGVYCEKGIIAKLWEGCSEFDPKNGFEYTLRQIEERL